MANATAAERAGPFVFVGENLALDLVNTEIVVRGRRRDLLASADDLARWWEAARAHYPDAGLDAAHPLLARPDAALLAAVRAFREALRATFSAVAGGEAIPADHLAALNRVLRAGFVSLGLGPDGRPVLRHERHDHGSDGLLLPIARAAADLLTDTELTRLHRCQNERCILLFYDTTRSATRRWCSTGCMERARSLRRYRERRAGDGRREAGDGRRETGGEGTTSPSPCTHCQGEVPSKRGL